MACALCSGNTRVLLVSALLRKTFMNVSLHEVLELSAVCLSLSATATNAYSVPRLRPAVRLRRLTVICNSVVQDAHFSVEDILYGHPMALQALANQKLQAAIFENAPHTKQV